MGKYFNPPGDVPKIGRLVDWGDYAHMVGQLREGEVLIGLYYRPQPYLAAALIDSPEELGRQNWGSIERRADYYALARAVADLGFASGAHLHVEEARSEVLEYIISRGDRETPVSVAKPESIIAAARAIDEFYRDPLFAFRMQLIRVSSAVTKSHALSLATAFCQRVIGALTDGRARQLASWVLAAGAGQDADLDMPTIRQVLADFEPDSDVHVGAGELDASRLVKKACSMLVAEGWLTPILETPIEPWEFIEKLKATAACAECEMKAGKLVLGVDDGTRQARDERYSEASNRVDVANDALYRCVLGVLLCKTAFKPAWLTTNVELLARGISNDAAYDRLPILADALEDAGCDSADILDHCRGPGPHVRGCWVVDLVLGKV